MQVEVWKPISGYEDSYEVSNLGNVRSIDRVTSAGRFYRGRILKQRENGNGYYFVTLSKDCIEKHFTVHRLVAFAFCGDEKEEVNHKDGDKKNNNAKNLEWVTKAENALHAHRTGLKKPLTKGKFAKKVTDEEKEQIRTCYVAYSPEFGSKALAKKYGVTPSTIHRLLRTK